jgi:hypothetical protein
VGDRVQVALGELGALKPAVGPGRYGPERGDWWTPAVQKGGWAAGVHAVGLLRLAAHRKVVAARLRLATIAESRPEPGDERVGSGDYSQEEDGRERRDELGAEVNHGGLVSVRWMDARSFAGAAQ